MLTRISTVLSVTFCFTWGIASAGPAPRSAVDGGDDTAAIAAYEQSQIEQRTANLTDDPFALAAALFDPERTLSRSPAYQSLMQERHFLTQQAAYKASDEGNAALVKEVSALLPEQDRALFDKLVAMAAASDIKRRTIMDRPSVIYRELSGQYGPSYFDSKPGRVAVTMPGLDATQSQALREIYFRQTKEIAEEARKRADKLGKRPNPKNRDAYRAYFLKTSALRRELEEEYQTAHAAELAKALPDKQRQLFTAVFEAIATRTTELAAQHQALLAKAIGLLGRERLIAAVKRPYRAGLKSDEWTPPALDTDEDLRRHFYLPADPATIAQRFFTCDDVAIAALDELRPARMKADLEQRTAAAQATTEPFVDRVVALLPAASRPSFARVRAIVRDYRAKLSALEKPFLAAAAKRDVTRIASLPGDLTQLGYAFRPRLDEAQTKRLNEALRGITSRGNTATTVKQLQQRGLDARSDAYKAYYNQLTQARRAETAERQVAAIRECLPDADREVFDALAAEWRAADQARSALVDATAKQIAAIIGRDALLGKTQ